MDNAWGILKCIINYCMKLEEGKYLIFKDPNKPALIVYDIPDNTFETDEDEFDEELPLMGQGSLTGAEPTGETS